LQITSPRCCAGAEHASAMPNCQRRLKSDPLSGEIVERNLTHLGAL
jgi:hypothetical protein